MRDVVGAFAGRVTESIAWIIERGSELRDARRTAEQEFELSEGRKREDETELEAREVEKDRGMTH